jgi:hypothetical protein
MATTFREQVEIIRGSLIYEIEQHTNVLVQDPTAGEYTGVNSAKSIEQGLASLNAFMRAYETEVQATGNARSNLTFAFNDLPGDEKERYERAKHHLRILNALYGPAEEKA